MEHLTQPLITKTTEVSTPRSSLTTLEEESITGSNERDSSFIEIKPKRRTASLPATGQDTRDGKRRYASLSVADPRNSLGSPKNSVIISGDDRFILEESESVSIGEDDGDEEASGRFVNVHYIRGNSSGDASTSLALEACKKTVLRPYYIFLKMVGWRRFSDKKSDLVQPWNRRILNVVYPIGIFILLITGNVAQILTCFGRGDGFNTIHDVDGGECHFIYASCKDVIITSLVFPGIVILIAYIFGCYVFRLVYPENLATLTEKVFLDFTASHGAFSQKRLIYSLRAVMVIGMMWQVYAIGLNMIRMFSLELFYRHTYVDVTSDYTERELIELYSNSNCSSFPPGENDAFRYITVILSAFGLVLTDFFYLAAVIHYALECQLIIFLIRATADRIRSRCWAVDDAIKEIKVSQDFLNVLNGHLAYMVSLLLFVFAGLFLEGARSLYQLDSAHRFTVIVTTLNVIEWSIVIAIPIVQGVRLTIAGNELETLGQELRTRPFVYRDVPQLDLDSFVMYTSNLNMNAKLVNIPLHTSLVLPALFFAVILWRQLIAGEQLALGRWF